MRARLSVLAVCGLLVAGCSLSPHVGPAGQLAAAALVSFDACDDALDHLKREATERVGPWGLGGLTVAYAEGDMAMEDSAGADGRAAAPAHSTTTVQEAGVDEPDIVKTDGRLVVTVVGPNLKVVDTTGAAPVEVGSLKLGDEYADASVLLEGDRAVVFVRTSPMIAYDTRMSFAPMPGELTTQVLLVDLSDPASPTVEATLDVDGDYLDARLVDGVVRMVVSTSPALEFPMTEADLNRSEDELTARNKTIVAESTIDDWLPSYRLTSGGTESSGRLVECDRLEHPEEFAGFTTLSVLTLDLAAGLTSGDAVGVLTDGDTVYASTDRLYVATSRWTSVEPAADLALLPDGNTTTGIHAFVTEGNEPARYVASGEVEGRILGRYALSEHDDVLRVATTTDRWDASPEADQSESQLVTLTERDGELVELGRVGGLGKGEQIQAVRYFGPTAYVVTFRQTDPLYVLDLTDPAAPAVDGELKITGYSAYLHEVGAGRLVGVGQEATAEGMTVGAQVSLFDVADPAAPTKLDGHLVENAYSQAEWDPHAFLYWPETSQLVVPIDGEAVHGAVVLTVGADALTEQGVVTYAGDGSAEFYPTVLRSIVIGDSLYTLWSDGMQVNELDGLELDHWLPLA